MPGHLLHRPSAKAATSSERLLGLLHSKVDSQEDPAIKKSTSTDVAIISTVLWMYICTTLSYTLGAIGRLRRRYTSIRPFFFTRLEEGKEQLSSELLALEKDSLVCLRELLAGYRTTNPLVLQRIALELRTIERQIRGLALEERRLKFALHHSWGLGRASMVLEACWFLVDCLTFSFCVFAAPWFAYFYVTIVYIEPAYDAAKRYVARWIVRWTPQVIFDFFARIVPYRWRAVWTHLGWFSLELAVVGCVVYLRGLEKCLDCDARD